MHKFGFSHAGAKKEVAKVRAEEAGAFGGVRNCRVNYEFCVEKRSYGGRRIEDSVSDLFALRDFVFVDEVDGICCRNTIFIALCEASKLVT